jgi:hypothetical protein
MLKKYLVKEIKEYLMIYFQLLAIKKEFLINMLLNKIKLHLISLNKEVSKNYLFLNIFLIV